MKYQSQDFVIVGNGLGVLQLFLHPEYKDSSLKLSWKPTLSRKDPHTFYVIAPSAALAATYAGTQLTLGLNETFFFFQKTRRFSGSELLFTNATSIPLPLRKKIVALALFNDLSPQVWSSHNDEPFSNWIEKSPLTLKNSGSDLGISILPQKQLFQEYNRLAFKKTDENSYPVLSIKIDEQQKQGVIAFAPPRQAESYRSIICTDYLQIRNSEIELKQKAAGAWQSYLARVPRSRVAALPLFSVWTDSLSESFLTTGHIQDQCLKRVLVIPDSQSEDCLLQIQILRSDPFASTLENIPQFLYSLCPRLESMAPKFEACVLEDDVIFENPDAVYEKHSEHLLYWKVGSLGRSPEFFRKILRKFKVKGPGLPLDAGQSSQ